MSCLEEEVNFLPPETNGVENIFEMVAEKAPALTDARAFLLSSGGRKGLCSSSCTSGHGR